jgi:uncharacterized protein YbjT (DUF2867 family)
VRLLLDANLSGRRLARPLRDDGHDVVALIDRPELEGLADPEVLALAAAGGGSSSPATAATSRRS